MLKIKWKDMMTNEEVLQQIGLASPTFVSLIKARKGNLFEHFAGSSSGKESKKTVLNDWKKERGVGVLSRWMQSEKLGVGRRYH